MNRRDFCNGLGALSLGGACAPAALAQTVSVDAFYRRNRQLTILSYSPGVSENYARLLARHMGRHMPGEPSFVVSGMPGAGGMKAIDYLGSGLIDQSQNITVAAMQMADMNVWAHRS